VTLPVGECWAPRQRRLDRHGRRIVGIEVSHETRQKPSGLGKFVSKRTTELQIVHESLLEGAHRAAPGQGWQTLRNVPRSTLA
jgi:hypothetical protein